jgi:hypothetical protein
MRGTVPGSQTVSSGDGYFLTLSPGRME